MYSACASVIVSPKPALWKTPRITDSWLWSRSAAGLAPPLASLRSDFQ